MRFPARLRDLSQRELVRLALRLPAGGLQDAVIGEIRDRAADERITDRLAAVYGRRTLPWR